MNSWGLGHSVRIMPHDVWTWWNLTYDMLKFALKYKEAIKIVTSDLVNNKEWALVKELPNTYVAIIFFLHLPIF